jgi:hypothetical protein
MASRSASLQKQRAALERARARANGGGLRSQPAEEPPGRSASTGGLATKRSARSSLNSRSSNSGKK